MPNKFGAHFFQDESGTTVIEYGLIGALISVVCITAMTFVGTELTAFYNVVSTAVTGALAP
jgi:pilus assembly protein Flp/PilA